MAAEAEASREAGAKMIAAEGELRASRALADAASVIAASKGAMQLRYLQTLNTIRWAINIPYYKYYNKYLYKFILLKIHFG